MELLYHPYFQSLILLVSLLIWLKLAKGKNLNLPPSPPKLPIIGNIHQLGKLPHRSLRDLCRKYGSLMLLQMGYNPTLVVSSVEMVREIAKNHDIVFSDRPRNTAADILFYGRRDVAFAPYGEYWRQLRKIIALELLSHKRVHSFQFARDKEVEVLINKITHASIKGESIDLTQMLLSFSDNLVSRCVLSGKNEKEEDSHRKFGDLARRITFLITSFCIGDMFPYLRWLDVLTGFIPSLKAASKESNTFLDQIIEDHRALTSHNEVNNRKDFVSIILQLQKDGLLEMDLTQDNIKAIILDTFLGGTDTTATTLEWMMAELLKHPNIMKKVQEEVRNVVGKKSKVDIDDINEMEYLKCVLKETFRLHPVSPFLLRKTSASVKLGGYDVPSNLTVSINVWAIQRDPKWWENPEEFIPERFENSSVDFKGQNFQFIPFGFGRRGCPGLQFGVTSVEYVIANLLYWFDWKLPADETRESLDMSELFGLSLSKKIPLHVIPISRLSI